MALLLRRGDAGAECMWATQTWRRWRTPRF